MRFMVMVIIGEAIALNNIAEITPSTCGGKGLPRLPALP